MVDLLQKANQYINDNKEKVIDLWRPRFHLAGECGWINDPNGFIQYKGTYHLFYQHYPFASEWGPMYWGHATSKDLITWTYQPVALAPDRRYDSGGCFSGSAIESGGKLHVLYTGHDVTSDMVCETQCLAISSDGISFDKYEGNPVIGIEQVPPGLSWSDFRDPRVIKRNGIFYMLVGSHDASDRGHILLYRSEDLKKWQFVNALFVNDGTLGRGTFECPDLVGFEYEELMIFSPQFLPQRGEDFHNLHSSVYMRGCVDFETGIFSGKGPYPLDKGFDFYAPQILKDDKGRRIMVAWMDMWESPMPTSRYGHNWAGMMTLPREMILEDDRLRTKPIEEIKGYRENEFCLGSMIVEGQDMLPTEGVCYELEVQLHDTLSSMFGIKIRVGDNEETDLRLLPDQGLLEFDRSHSGKGPGGVRQAKIKCKGEPVTLRIFVDKSSVEVFVNDGEAVLSGRIYPDEKSKGIVVYSDNRTALTYLKKWDLRLEESV